MQTRRATAKRAAKIPGGHCVPVDFMERIEIRHDGGVLSALTGYESITDYGQGLKLPVKSESGWIESATGSHFKSAILINSKRRRIY